MHRPDHNAGGGAAAQSQGSYSERQQLRLGIVGAMGESYAAELAQRFPRVAAIPAGEGELDALVMWESRLDEVVAAVRQEPRLRWVHLRWAGVAAPVLEALRGHPAVLTNGSGAHGLAVAEYVAGVVLAHYKGFDEMRVAQERCQWLDGFGIRELRGSLVGILGLGDLGLSTARVLRAFGVRLRGLRRSAAACSYVDELYTPAELHAFLQGLDVLVVATPLTKETRGLIGSTELALLARGALLVNVGRALVVRQDAMLAALQSGQLGGAALDVFEEEPLPESSPLWRTPNVFISPHCCDASPQSLDRGLEIFLDNLARFVDGEELQNVVDRDAGY